MSERRLVEILEEVFHREGEGSLKVVGQSSDELLVNPSFEETPDFRGWVVSGSAGYSAVIDIVTVHAEGKSAKLTIPANGYVALLNSPEVEPKIDTAYGARMYPCHPGKPILVTAYVATDANVLIAGLVASFYDSKKHWIASINYQPLGAGVAWTAITHVFTAPNGAAFMRLGGVANAVALSAATAWFDDFHVPAGDISLNQAIQEFDVYLHEADDGTYIVTPAITADGVQDSDAKTTTTANVDIVVFQARVYTHSVGLTRALKGVYYNLEARLCAVSSITADLTWKWQAKNASGVAWVDLHAAVVDADIGIAYLSRIRKGFIRPIANLTESPFDIRLLLQCNELNEGRGRIRNTCFVTVKMTVV